MALVIGWLVSNRVSRFLLRRYVLLADLRTWGELYMVRDDDEALTPVVQNIELFFCLYAQDWRNPPMCNSSHSRLLGFFSALPGIWRALQCIRRYWDTKNVFPHLVNCGKYICTILYYMSLSLYRIEKTNSSRALFIFFATINAVYCSVWDIVMDWSTLLLVQLLTYD